MPAKPTHAAIPYPLRLKQLEQTVERLHKNVQHDMHQVFDVANSTSGKAAAAASAIRLIYLRHIDKEEGNEKRFDELFNDAYREMLENTRRAYEEDQKRRNDAAVQAAAPAESTMSEPDVGVLTVDPALEQETADANG